MSAVITRRWLGPIAPAASSAAVVGNAGGSAAPISGRRGVSSWACSARASLADRLNTPVSNRFPRQSRGPRDHPEETNLRMRRTVNPKRRTAPAYCACPSDRS